jgi:hypothetical protein
MEFLGFAKLPALVSAKNKEAKDLTADELNAVAAELSASGYGCIVAALQSVGQVSATPPAEVATLQSQLSAANTQLSTMTTELSAEKQRVTQLTTELATAQAEVTRLGGLPGADPAAPITDTKTEGDSTPGTNPFWSETDEAVKLAKAKMTATKI